VDGSDDFEHVGSSLLTIDCSVVPINAVVFVVTPMKGGLSLFIKYIQKK